MVSTLFEKMRSGISVLLEKRASAVENYGKMLDISDPEAIVNRGYAIIYDRETGRTVTSASEGEAGRRLDIKLRDGIIESEAVSVRLGEV